LADILTVGDPPTDSSKIPNIVVKPIGYNGLKVTSGVIYEECDAALRWPQCIYTYKQMLKDATVAVSVDAVMTKMASAKWSIKAPAGYEEPLKWYIDKLETMRHDMDHSWFSFQQNAASFVPFGFAPFEIIPRKRLKKKGSKYNDGFWGLGKLALRSQDTITGVQYSDDGREFEGFWQHRNNITNRGQMSLKKLKYNEQGDVLLPKDWLLVFRNAPLKDSPLGTSPLSSIYEAWKYKKAYEENRSYGVIQDVQGLKVLYIPHQYMSDSASEADKLVFAEYQKIMRNIHIGKESGLILPQVTDGNGETAFKFEVISVNGSKAYDVSEIINSYKNEIITALYANSLVAGQEGGGSFALSESLIAIQNKVIEARLSEIKDVLNHQLIPLIFEWNGWETEVYPYFDFETLTELTFDQKTKGYYQMLAAGGVILSAKNINHMQKEMGLPDRLPEDMPVEKVREQLSGNQTKAAEGFKTTGDGTSTSPNGSNGSATNAFNK